MSRHLQTAGPRALFTRARAERRARRVLEQELADYTTAADRDALEVLIDEAGTTDDEVARILRGQAQAQLFRVG
jgi:hypothetical protein